MGTAASAAPSSRAAKPGKKVVASDLQGIALMMNGAWTVDELRRLLAVFRTLSRGTFAVRLADFHRYTCTYGLPASMVRKCFDLFDTSGKGYLEFVDFVLGVTKSQRGTLASRAQFLFSLYAEVVSERGSASSGSGEPEMRMSAAAALQMLRDARGEVTCAAQAQELQGAAGKPPSRRVVFLNNEALSKDNLRKDCARLQELMQDLRDRVQSPVADASTAGNITPFKREPDSAPSTPRSAAVNAGGATPMSSARGPVSATPATTPAGVTSAAASSPATPSVSVATLGVTSTVASPSAAQLQVSTPRLCLNVAPAQPVDVPRDAPSPRVRQLSRVVNLSLPEAKEGETKDADTLSPTPASPHRSPFVPFGRSKSPHPPSSLRLLSPQVSRLLSRGPAVASLSVCTAPPVTPSSDAAAATTPLSPRVAADTADVWTLSLSLRDFVWWCTNGFGEHKRLLQRFNPIPRVTEECAIISEMLTRHSLVDGAAWCLVSIRWWQAWMDYSSFSDDSGVVMQHRKGSVADARKGSSHVVSMLSNFSGVLVELTRAVGESGAFAGAEGQAGRGLRSSRVLTAASLQSLQSLSGSTPLPTSPAAGSAQSSGSASQPTVSPVTEEGRRSSTASPGASPVPSVFRPRVDDRKASRMSSDAGSGLRSSLSMMSTPPGAMVASIKNRLMNRQASFANAIARPSAIDNSDLAGASPDLVRWDAVEHEHYVLLPEEAFVQLMCWYGGGPTFPRKVIAVAVGGSGGAGSAPDATPTRCEVEVWPLPLTLKYLVPDEPTSLLGLTAAVTTPRVGLLQPPTLSSFVIDVRVSLRRCWQDVMDAAMALYDEAKRRSGERSPAQHCGGTASSPIRPLSMVTPSWLIGAPTSVLKPVNAGHYRMHVQSVLKDEVLHYRLDTEDALQPVDDSFLVGGETVVIERRHADATWTLPSAKGPRMWKNLEVGDYVDAKLRMNAWTAAVVEEVAGAKALVAAIDKNGKSIGESAWLVAEDAIAPFRSRSRAQAATPATASFVSKLRHLRVTSASHADLLGDINVPRAAEESKTEALSPTSRRQRWSQLVRPGVIALALQSGVCGLRNLGNTCFMNATLQCLNTILPVTNYFLTGAYKDHVNTSNPLGMGGKLARNYARLLDEMWSGNDSIINPLQFKVSVAKFAPQFSGHNQHDAQELLAFLLDGLHEDLNLVTKKTYREATATSPAGRPDTTLAAQAWALHLERNQSIVVDLMQGQLKSTVSCRRPGCTKESVTFDPFMFLSLPMPVETHRNVAVSFVPLRHTVIGATEGCQWVRPSAPASSLSDSLARSTIVTMSLRVSKRSKVIDLVKAVSTSTGIAIEQLLPLDVYKNKVYKALSEVRKLSQIRDTDSVVVYQVDPRAEFFVEVSQVHTAAGRGSAQPQPCGTPFVLSCSLATTYRDVHSQITAQLSLALSKHGDAARFLECTMLSTRDIAVADTGVAAPAVEMSADAAPFIVRLVNQKHGGCGLCTSGRCKGCVLPMNDNRLTLLEDASLLVEWKREWWERASTALPAYVPFAGGSSGEAVTLTSLFDRFAEEEMLESDNAWYCSSCKCLTKAKKKLDVWNAPSFLVLHLKRFAFSAQHKEKIHTPVEFPLEGLDLSKHVRSPFPPHDDPAWFAFRAAPPLVYDLFAVTNHMGGLGGGHYTATAKTPEGHWYTFDDARAVQVDPTTAINGSDAYVLFYARRET